MSTNPIGQGTKNISLNVPQSEWRALSRLAASHDVSLGGLVKRLTMIGLEQTEPDTALVVRDARRRHRQAKALACCAAGFLALGLQIAGAGMDPMRAARGRVGLRGRNKIVRSYQELAA